MSIDKQCRCRATLHLAIIAATLFAAATPAHAIASYPSKSHLEVLLHNQLLMSSLFFSSAMSYFATRGTKVKRMTLSILATTLIVAYAYAISFLTRMPEKVLPHEWRSVLELSIPLASMFVLAMLILFSKRYSASTSNTWAYLLGVASIFALACMVWHAKSHVAVRGSPGGTSALAAYAEANRQNRLNRANYGEEYTAFLFVGSDPAVELTNISKTADFWQSERVILSEQSIAVMPRDGFERLKVRVSEYQHVQEGPALVMIHKIMEQSKCVPTNDGGLSCDGSTGHKAHSFVGRIPCAYMRHVITDSTQADPDIIARMMIVAHCGPPWRKFDFRQDIDVAARSYPYAWRESQEEQGKDIEGFLSRSTNPSIGRLRVECVRSTISALARQVDEEIPFRPIIPLIHAMTMDQREDFCLEKPLIPKSETRG